ncbi:Aste57867_10889 [Aphanomyces stellatus]|uniref:Aste57867_10889 protein n=1 Tax=Aphanomyces stellatus TaxID=120398 RepID=A0A485KS84_9STRA|nr:hypothetical protein As57867_010849 [Aphanomyces stellatus]VFT87757.1 Aste57867_10889 [Aphanomyces stellatus]
MVFDLRYKDDNRMLPAWYAQWARIGRITHVQWLGKRSQPEHLLTLLHHLPHLVSLNLQGYFRHAFKPYVLWGLVGRIPRDHTAHGRTPHSLFTTRHVKVFSVALWTWRVSNRAIVNAFLVLVLNCPTLDTLALTACDLNHVACKITLHMKCLTLDACEMSPAMLKQLAAALPTSNNETLAIKEHRSVDGIDLAELIDALPLSRVNSLNLKCFDWAMDPLNVWAIKGSKLKDSCLETLRLEYCHIVDVDAIEIAKDLQYNITIKSLHVEGNQIDLSGAMALLVCRPASLRNIDLGYTELHLKDIETLLELAQLRNVQLSISSREWGDGDY